MKPISTSQKRRDFWACFERSLVKHGVSEKNRPFYRKHLERWGTYRRSHAAEGEPTVFLERYLRELGGNPRFEDWRIVQTAQAIRWAHGECLGESWVDEVDWVGLEESFREISENHEAVGPQVGLEEIETRARARARGLGPARAATLALVVKRLRERGYAFPTVWR